MRKLTMLSAVAALCAVFAAPAYAGTVEYSGANIQIDVPDGWSSSEADGVLTLASPDGSVAIVVAVMTDKTAKKGAKSLDKVVATYIPGAKLKKARKSNLNGLEGYVRSGAATVEGAAVDLEISVVETKDKQVVMVLALGVVGLYEQYGAEMADAMTSVSSIRTKVPEAFYKELSDPRGRAVVEAVLLAIDQNDSAALSKYIAKDFYYFGKKMKAKTVKRKAKKKVVKWLKVPEGGFHWEIAAGPGFTIQKGSGYGNTWSIEFYDEAAEDENYTGSRWRVSSVYYVDMGAP
jgi:hypothetical protein